MAARPLDLLGRAEQSSSNAALRRAEGAELDGESAGREIIKFAAIRVVVGHCPRDRVPDSTVYDWDYRWSIEKDFANPACQDYQVRPISELREPASDQACWHIYLSRKYDDTRTVPYTLAVYDRKSHAYWRNYYLQGLGIGIIGTVTLSALVYFAGWVIAWILRGFRRAV
jgi:hypothetical protein